MEGRMKKRSSSFIGERQHGNQRVEKRGRRK
jgi:hypothetical protein